MATISIADNDARKQYTQAVVGTDTDPGNETQLTIDFPFFNLDDINVIKTTSAGVDTTLSRGTGTGTFAVTGTSVDDGFEGGHIILHDTSTDATIRYTIFRDITVERTTDFPTSGPFNVSALNTELDKIFAIEQELETKISRTMKLADSDAASSITLPDTSARSSKFLSFDANGNLTVTTTIGTFQGSDATVTTAAYVKHDLIKSTTASELNNVYICIADSSIGDSLTNTSKFTLVVDAVSASTSATNAATSASTASDHRADAGKYAVTSHNTTFTLTATNGGTSGLYSALHYSTESANSATSSASSATTANDWATKTSGSVAGGEYSAKEYASGVQTTTGSSKQWAIGGGASYDVNTAVAGGVFSAKYYAEAAANSASTASGQLSSFQAIWHGTSATDPSGGTVDDGDLYFNSSSQTLKVYSSGAWVDAAISGATNADKGFATAMAVAL